MVRGNQIARQWAVIKTFGGRSKGIIIADLSSNLKINSSRIIYADLNCFQKAGMQFDSANSFQWLVTFFSAASIFLISWLICR
ncbi:hypothetical protein FBR05_03195 [Deltaproteobacteria bacterium PRO3]|nr:hypothetical protein [Deltaproteobacteria bacterium PRO3]